MAHRMYDLAAIQIQSIYRGFWVRDCLNVDHYCAAVIQKAFRRFHPRINSYYDLFRIVIVQSVWRRNIARGNTSNKLAHIIAIQAGFRGFKARRKLTRHLDRMWQADRTGRAIRDAAVLPIQSRWRSYACETHFIRSLVDILIVQTIFRRWSAKRRAAVLRKARAKRIATRNLVKQVDDSQRMQKQLGSSWHSLHGSEDNLRNVPENGLNLSYDEPGQINTSAVQGSPEEQGPPEDLQGLADLQGPPDVQGAPEVYKNNRPESDFKPVKQVKESDEINTPAPKAVELPAIYSSPVGDERSDLAASKVQEYHLPSGLTIKVRREAKCADADSMAANASIKVAGKKVQENDVPPAIYSSPVEDERSDSAARKVQEYDVPSGFTISVRKDAKFADADSRAANGSIEVASNKVQENDVPPAVTILVRKDTKPPVVDFKPVKESSDLSFYEEQEYDAPTVSAPVPKEEKNESANCEFDDPGEAKATNLLAMWKKRDEKNTLVIGRSKR